MKKFFVIILIVGIGLFGLYKYGYISINPIGFNIPAQVPQTQTSITSEVPASNQPTQVINGLRIDGIVVAKGNEIIDSTYKAVIDKGMASSKKPEVHIWTAFYSNTLGKTVLIDNNTLAKSREFYDVDGKGKRFYGVDGESLKDKPAEECMQTYVAMKGLAKAIDGSK